MVDDCFHLLPIIVLFLIFPSIFILILKFILYKFYCYNLCPSISVCFNVSVTSTDKKITLSDEIDILLKQAFVFVFGLKLMSD